jgi:arabinose-5-phosphate isomerase
MLCNNRKAMSISPCLGDNKDLIEARRVIETEISGMSALLSSLDESFTKAIDVFIGTKGRVILTGVGKSGHIGRKISSTLSSTGTPSFFIHPAEASHGDLGMLKNGDSILAISNSGETKELSEILIFAKTNDIKVVSITQKAKSTLAKMSDVVLLLPPAKEACPLLLAPTTSSLLTLAYGDAIAMTLIGRRGFTPTDFGRLHPGGKLGARLITVEKTMRKSDLPIVNKDTSMRDAIITITEKSLGCTGVIDDNGSLCGIITDGDLRRNMSNNLLEKTAEEIMTHEPFMLRRDILAQEAIAKMSLKKITGAFVTDEHSNKPVGFVHMHDCIRQGLISEDQPHEEQQV